MGSGEWGARSGEWGVGSGEWGVGSGEWGEIPVYVGTDTSCILGAFSSISFLTNSISISRSRYVTFGLTRTTSQSIPNLLA